MPAAYPGPQCANLGRTDTLQDARGRVASARTPDPGPGERCRAGDVQTLHRGVVSRQLRVLVVQGSQRTTGKARRVTMRKVELALVAFRCHRPPLDQRLHEARLQLRG